MANEYEDDFRRTRSDKRDLVLAPGEYAYVQELTKGTIQVLVGPTTFAPTAQHQAVVYTQNGDKPFRPVEHLEHAVQKSAIAVEGMYLQLLNPTTKGLEAQPEQGHHSATPSLIIGRKVNIPGPVMFSLWPGQSAKLIKGHTLRSNQYLLVRVYNEEEARTNWRNAVIKKNENGEEKDPVVVDSVPPDLTVGKQYVIKGTEVSFYIPPTGVTVVQDDASGEYTRNALTLERLEYCILVNEGGDKRYEKGPAVVFPAPNERFIVSPSGEQKFRAIELNPIQGIYVKVISDYSEGGKTYKAGEELFITGNDTPIYFPRQEHSLIKYDNKTKHFATAIPEGEGRYIMNRLSGEISTVKGPSMSLPDPRTQVFVHRRLTENECRLWYPGNTEAVAYNKSLATLQTSVSHTRGAISEGDLRRKNGNAQARGGELNGADDAVTAAATYSAFFADATVLGDSAKSFMPDEFERGNTYTQPRMMTLNTKYQGVPLINLFTGYAVQVVSANGSRRTELGPTRILMGYDETLEILRLSTGKPKTTDNLLETVYLRVKNNKISDIVVVETSDHVKVSFKLSFLADFEGDSSKWFEVENYVKLLSDHVRSLLAGAGKKLNVATLYANAITFVRDSILGEKTSDGREGLFFEECGLRVRDVEVLDVSIKNNAIANLLDAEQHAVVAQNIELDREKRNFSHNIAKQEIVRELEKEKMKSEVLKTELEAERAALQLQNRLIEIENSVKLAEERKKIAQAEEEVLKLKARSALDRQREERELRHEFETKQQELYLVKLLKEAEAILKKSEQFGPQFAAALTTLANNETMEKIAAATSVQRMIGGESAVDVLKQVFKGFPVLENYLENKMGDVIAAE